MGLTTVQRDCAACDVMPLRLNYTYAATSCYCQNL